METANYNVSSYCHGKREEMFDFVGVTESLVTSYVFLWLNVIGNRNQVGVWNSSR